LENLNGVGVMTLLGGDVDAVVVEDGEVEVDADGNNVDADADDDADEDVIDTPVDDEAECLFLPESSGPCPLPASFPIKEAAPVSW